MDTRKQTRIEQVEEIEKQHARQDCHEERSIRYIYDFYILNNHVDCATNFQLK